MFDLVPGQRHVKELFARALRDDAFSHAYLFTGPEGLGKTAFARELAVALVASCDGCGACPECERARRGVHPDLHVVEREGPQILLEHVRPIIADLALRPFAASRRVWIIPEVEHLNDAAANKLLKSIEEPPAYVVFLLVTDRLERVIPTILSRCQLVEFHPLSDVEVEGHLRERYALEGAEAQALARLSHGAVERADRLAEDVLGRDGAPAPRRRGQYLQYAAGAVAPRRGEDDGGPAARFVGEFGREVKDIDERIRARLERTLGELALQFQDKRDLKWHQDNAEKYAKREQNRLRRVAAQDAVDVLASWVRDLWVVACGASDVLWNCDRADELVAAAVAAPDHYARLLAVIARTRKDLYLNVDQKLALQALFARFEEVAARV